MFPIDITGYILVNLPLEPHSDKQIDRMRKSFNEVRENQFALFLLYVAQRQFDFLTKILPQCWIRLLFNYLSKHYTVSITELADGYPRTDNSDIDTMLWEDKILDIIYFTPPQSNISENFLIWNILVFNFVTLSTGVSLTFQRFGQHIRLAVMTDAIIRPLHNKISQTWSQYIHDMMQ